MKTPHQWTGLLAAIGTTALMSQPVAAQSLPSIPTKGQIVTSAIQTGGQLGAFQGLGLLSQVVISVPSNPGTPSVGSFLPDLPATPPLPGLPRVPSLPSAPGVPALPQFPAAVPDLAGPPTVDLVLNTIPVGVPTGLPSVRLPSPTTIRPPSVPSVALPALPALPELPATAALPL